MLYEIPAFLFFLLAISGVYNGYRYYTLHRNGLIKGDGRPSFRKLNHAMATATSEEDKKALLRFRKSYTLHVILFWTALSTTICILFLFPHHTR